MYVLMAGGRFVCHVSEFPVGSYKKGHGFLGSGGGDSRTGLQSETSYLFLSGDGYDLQWPPGAKPGPDTEWSRIDFKPGSLMTNGRGGHQHFNASDEPARYLVLRYGNMLFGQRGQAREQAQDRSSQGAGLGQIEYPDEDPRIRALFEEECAKRAWPARCPRWPEPTTPAQAAPRLLGEPLSNSPHPFALSSSKGPMNGWPGASSLSLPLLLRRTSDWFEALPRPGGASRESRALRRPRCNQRRECPACRQHDVAP